MFKRYLIVASKLDKAGINITTQLSQFGRFDFYLVDSEIIYTQNLNMEKVEEYDFIIFASKHQSEKKEKTLSIHAPGNWKAADFGGEVGKICKSSALFQKELFEKLNKNVDEFRMNRYKVTLECTHHGPLISKPCVFIEIGSTEIEWADKKAAFVIAKTIKEAIEEFKENPYREVAIGIGGPHYCPNFNKIQLESNVALSHIIPQYVLPMNEEMIREAVSKTCEDIDFFVLDWKGIGPAEERKKIIAILNKLYLNYKKTSEIKK